MGIREILRKKFVGTQKRVNEKIEKKLIGNQMGIFDKPKTKTSSSEKQFDFNTLISKLPLVIATGLGGFLGATYLGIPIWIIVLAGIFLFYLIFYQELKNSPFMKLILIIIVIVILFISGIIPATYTLASTYLSSQKGTYAVQTVKLSNSWTRIINNLNNYTETQIACASGACPTGEVEGVRTSISMTSPERYDVGELFVDDVFEVRSEIMGLNLKMYDTKSNVNTISINCNYTGNQSPIFKPATIRFADISNEVGTDRKRSISCELKAAKTDSGINEVNITGTFPYTTVGDLAVCIMNNERRDTMLDKWGQYTYEFECSYDPKSNSKYNDGPAKVGVAVTQIPLQISDTVSAELAIAIWNNWGGQNGRILKVDSIEIELPQGFSITDSKGSYKKSCPFAGSGGKYSLTDNNLTNIDNVRNFLCDLQVGNRVYEATEHIKVTATYQYQIAATGIFYVKEKETEEGTSGGSGTGGTSPEGSGTPSPGSSSTPSNTPTSSSSPSGSPGTEEYEMTRSIAVAPTATKDQIAKMIQKAEGRVCADGTPSKLIGTADKFYSTGTSAGIDPVFALAVAILESGWGNSSFACTKNNLFGIKYAHNPFDPSDPSRYESIDASIDEFYRLIKEEYVPNGQDSVAKISCFDGSGYTSHCYCWEGGVCPGWYQTIPELMVQIKEQ